VKNIITLLLSVFFAFGIISTSFSMGKNNAEPPAQIEPSELPYAAKLQQITGEVKAVNSNNMSIIVTKKLKEKVIETVVMVDDKTKITENSDKKTFTNLKIGGMVVVKYTKADGKNIAKSIVIKPTETESKK